MTLVYFINVDWYFSLHWRARCSAAQKAGYIVHLVTHFTNKSLLDQLRQEGIICHELPLVRKSFNFIRELILIRQVYVLLRRLKPDLVHCVTIKPNIYGGLVCRILGFSAVFSVTGRGSVFSGKNLKCRVIRPLISVLYRLVGGCGHKRFLFENGEDREFFIEQNFVDASEGQVIRGAGVDMELYSMVELKHKRQPIILFAARLLKDKGLEDLVNAVRMLRKQEISFSVQVAGIIDHDNNDALSLDLIEKWHKEGVIEWLGQSDDMISLLSQATIVALPSCYGEGVPRILIEAAAIGRPLVSCDVTGCRDIVRDGFNGFLVPPHDAKQLAEVLGRLLANLKLCQQFGVNGREYAQSEFCQEKVISETLSVYQVLMRGENDSCSVD